MGWMGGCLTLGVQFNFSDGLLIFKSVPVYLSAYK